MSSKQFKKNRVFLNNVNFFDSMTEEQKDSIANALILERFKDGEIIVHQGDQADSYYIIMEGKVCCVNSEGKEVRELSKGDSFGEQGLYKDSVRGIDVRAKGDVRMLALARASLQKILGAKIHEVIHNNWTRWALENDKIFNQLTKIQTEKIVKNIEFKKIEKNFIILKKGEKLNKIIIIIEGECKYGENFYKKGSIFGNTFLYPDKNFEKILDNDLIAIVENTQITTIEVEKFHKIINGTLQEILAKNRFSHEVAS